LISCNLGLIEIIEVSVPIGQKSTLDENRMKRDDKNSPQHKEKNS